jgi:predicted ATPase
MAQLKQLTVRGFKSIKELDQFELRGLNVLIGANGAGKSNFIDVFRLLSSLVQEQLKLFVRTEGGLDPFLHGGRKRTERIELGAQFGDTTYLVTLVPADEIFVIENEDIEQEGVVGTHALGGGHTESVLAKAQEPEAVYVRESIAGWRTFHFHDTSPTAAFRNAQRVGDNLVLKQDGGNLAPFLRYLYEQYPDHHTRIVETIRLVAPFFHDFVYRNDLTADDRVALEWLQPGDTDTPWGPRQLSDGTLRFIALATLLLQPTQLQPATILIDEPELGLHPYAIGLLADLLKEASDERQLILATQSAELLNAMDAEDVVVVGRADGASTLKRLDPEELAVWLKDDYGLGELWEMNVLGGRPFR